MRSPKRIDIPTMRIRPAVPRATADHLAGDGSVIPLNAGGPNSARRTGKNVTGEARTSPRVAPTATDDVSRWMNPGPTSSAAGTTCGHLQVTVPTATRPPTPNNKLGE